MTRARAACARLRSWWLLTVLDRRVRTFEAYVSFPREVLELTVEAEQEVTRITLEAARRQARDARYRIVTDAALEVGALLPADFLSNRTTVRATVRGAGYPARRWLVARDRTLELLRAPVPVAFGWLLLYATTCVLWVVKLLTEATGG